jgi:hypothetical protein
MDGGLSKNLYFISQTRVLGWYGEAEKVQGIWRLLHGGMQALPGWGSYEFIQ